MEILHVSEFDRMEILDISKNSFEWGDYIGDVFDDWIKNGIFLKAVKDGIIVGFLHIREYDKFIWLEGLRVRENYRRMGIGRLLTTKALEMFPGKISRMMIMETNIPSLRLAEKLKFKVIDRIYYKVGEKLNFGDIVKNYNLKISNEKLKENYVDEWVYFEKEYYTGNIYKNEEGLKILKTSPPFILNGEVDFESIGKLKGDECFLVLERKN
ncbi:MAG: GNAT family N-acetyltransferase [Thermoplasmata archaeon]